MKGRILGGVLKSMLPIFEAKNKTIIYITGDTHSMF